MRNRILIATVVIAALGLASCGGDSDVKSAKGDTSATKVTGETPKLTDKQVGEYFAAVASEDIDKIKAAKELAAPGSIAAAYIQAQGDISIKSATGKLSLQGGKPRFRFGSKAFEARLGKTAKVGIHLTRRARRLILKHTRVRIHVTLASSDAGAAATTHHLILAIKPPR